MIKTKRLKKKQSGKLGFNFFRRIEKGAVSMVKDGLVTSLQLKKLKVREIVWIRTTKKSGISIVFNRNIKLN